MCSEKGSLQKNKMQYEPGKTKSVPHVHRHSNYGILDGHKTTRRFDKAVFPMGVLTTEMLQWCGVV